MMILGIILAAASLTVADVPVTCYWADIEGTWTFSETERTGDSTLECDITSWDLNDVGHTHTFELSFPNHVVDELGNEGTWTMVSSQGFEVNINGRSYYASSAYDGDFWSSTSYCDKTMNGYSYERGAVRNWACFNGQKSTKVAPRKQYNTEKPLPNRYWKNDQKLINAINEKQSSWTAKAYPQFEKYTLQEMHQRAGGHFEPLPPLAPASQELKDRVSLLPDNFDWRNISGVNYISPVRDQQSCGSCYAFSSMALVEARLRIATNNQRQDIFSPQDIVECSPLSEGCSGGFKYLIGGRHAHAYGLISEECNEYTGQDGSCSSDSSCARTYVSDYNFVGDYYGGCNEELMKDALVNYGPMGVSYYVYDDFHNYGGGIYHHTDFKSDFNPHKPTNHAVFLVGYGVEPTTGEKFWTCKNSWGADWGEDGYFRIRRGTDEVAIGSYGVWADVIP